MPGTLPEGTQGLLTHGRREVELPADHTKTPEQKKIQAILFELLDMKSRTHAFDFEKVGEAQYDRSQGEFDANETVALPHNEGFIVTIRMMNSNKLYFTKSLDDVQRLRPLKSEITLEQIREKLD